MISTYILFPVLFSGTQFTPPRSVVTLYSVESKLINNLYPVLIHLANVGIQMTMFFSG